MTAQTPKPWSRAFSGVHKTDVRTQFSALCYRVKNDKVQVLLVTSRGTGRWILPKGWPIAGQSPSDAAATEAWEEAGAKGKIDGRPLGMYTYVKEKGEESLPCAVMVYALKVKKTKVDYPEAKERRRKWVSLKKAAKLVNSPELARMLMNFDPRLVH